MLDQSFRPLGSDPRQPLQDMALQTRFPAWPLDVSRDCTLGERTLLTRGEEHQPGRFIRIPSAQKRQTEEQGQGHERALNRLAPHTALGQILRGSLEDQRTARPGIRKTFGLCEETPVLDRFREIHQRLALDEQAVVDQVVADRKAFDLDSEFRVTTQGREDRA